MFLSFDNESMERSEKHLFGASDPNLVSSGQEKGGGPAWLWGILKSMPAALSQKDLASLLNLLADEERCALHMSTATALS